MIRFVIAILAFVLCLGVAQVSHAKSVQEEFAEAWAARAERYAAQQEVFDKQVEITWAALKASSDSNAPDVGARTSQFLAALDEGSFLHGRSAVLAAFQAHIKRKPSAAATELWIQERLDELKSKAAALDTVGVRLKDDNSADGIKAKMAALANSAVFMGNIAEMKLLDENLAIYFRAKSAQDDARRRARAAFFGAFAQGLARYNTTADRSWTATCQTSMIGRTTTCHGN